MSQLQCVEEIEEHCRITPPHFLAECSKRRLNQDSFVLLVLFCCILHFLFFLGGRGVVLVYVFLCTVLFVSISLVISCENRLRNLLEMRRVLIVLGS